MKKLILLLLISFMTIAAFTQSATVIVGTNPAAVTVNGIETQTITFPATLGEYDFSIQLIPALSGSGDSLDFSYVLYQSNAYSGNVWSILQTTKTVSSATDGDGVSNLTDFKGLRIKAIITGIPTDTLTVTPYIVRKKHRNE